MRDHEEFIERRIITGLIVSREYLTRIQRFWDPSLLESPELRKLSNWCLKYFHQYNKAPDDNITSIYMEQLKAGSLSKSEAQYFEELLESLSDEYGRGVQFNSAYLYDQTIKYFKAQELERHNQEVQALIDSGEVEEAEKLARSYSPKIIDDNKVGFDLSSKEAMERIERAFRETGQGIVSFPGALGDSWNEHLTRGSFFTFLAPEKRGKSFMLMEIAMRAVRQKANVAFFEAGDMTESQIIRRICVYISGRSDAEKYCRERFRPVGDCIYNQLDTCDRPDRNCDHGIFEGMEMGMFLKENYKHVTMEVLKGKYESFPEYEPCDSQTCKNRKGTPWLLKVKECQRLTEKQAKKEMKKFFRRYKRRFKLTAYPSGFLTVGEIRNVLDDWEKEDGFVPDVIVVDYADLLSADDGQVSEFRHRQDHIWKNLRALSQERHTLVLTATQADADSYKKGRLSISNFSEDKRKLAHVTTQYGLNQDPDGREKALGILRINEIVIRDGAFSNDRIVYILQDLAACRPFLESFL